MTSNGNFLLAGKQLSVTVSKYNTAPDSVVIVSPAQEKILGERKQAERRADPERK